MKVYIGIQWESELNALFKENNKMSVEIMQKNCVNEYRWRQESILKVSM
jgi:hypothetical protein